MVLISNHVRGLAFTLIVSLCLPASQCWAGGDKTAHPDEIKKFQEQLEASLKAPPKEADPMDSYAADFVAKVWKEPKYRYLAGSILVGETILSAMLVKRARLNAAQWTRQLETVKEVSASLKEVTSKLALAEQEVLNSLSTLSQADKAELAKSLAGGKTHLPALEAALKTQGAPGTAPALEVATANLENAYARWQQQAVAESRVLRAAGATVENPATIAEVSTAIEQRMRAVTQLQFSEAQFSRYRNAGFQHLADQANLGLGKDLSWRTRAWRKARTGLLLAAIPVVAVGVTLYYDREVEKNRRVEDLNAAATQDRNESLKTLIPYFHRPLLFAVVKAWNTVQQRADSPLRRFRCPVEVKELEQDNPDLTVVHAIAMQTMLDMREADEDVLEDGGGKTVAIRAPFFKRLFKKLLEHQASPLLHLKPAALDEVLGDLAYHAQRAFDVTE